MFARSGSLFHWVVSDGIAVFPDVEYARMEDARMFYSGTHVSHTQILWGMPLKIK